MSNSSIWAIDETLSGATTPDLSRPGNDGSEEVLRIPQSSSITGVSPSNCLVSYPGHSLGDSYPSAEIQLVYSIAPSDWARGPGSNGNKGVLHTPQISRIESHYKLQFSIILRAPFFEGKRRSYSFAVTQRKSSAGYSLKLLSLIQIIDPYTVSSILS